MDVVGYIAFAILIFLAVTWTIGVRTQLDAGTHTIIGALFFLVSVLVLAISGASKIHAVWLVPAGFIVPFIIVFLGNISHVLLLPFRLIAGLFANIVRIGIPTEWRAATQKESSNGGGEGKLAVAQQYLLGVIRVIRASLSASDVDMHGEKALLAQGLFYMGFVDALHQATNMTEAEFLQLQKRIFGDLGFGSAFSAKILLFHQTGQVGHPAFKAILAGGKFFGQLSSGDKAVESMLAGNKIAELVRDPSIPSSAALL